MSLLSESLRLLDGEQEFLSELLQASVGRQIQTVEAVRTRQGRQAALSSNTRPDVQTQIIKFHGGLSLTSYSLPPVCKWTFELVIFSYTI